MGATEHGDGDWLPSTRGGRGRGGGRHVGRRVLVVLLVVLLAGLAWFATLAATGLSALGRMDVPGLGAGDDGVSTVLVVGSDSRDELSQEERDALTTGGEVGEERTDTILLVQSDGEDVAVLSFPRDLWVTRCDGSSQRINTAVQVDGIGCLVETVQEVSGIEVDHAVRVGFGGFVEVVDAVGGVEVCLPSPIADVDAGIDLPAGCQVLDGTDALGFVRVRKIDDDLRRIQRQQEFLQALAQQVARPGTVLVPTTALPTARALGGAVSVDRGLGPVGLARLALAARGLAQGTALTATVPTVPEQIGGADVLLPAAEADEVFAAFRDGGALAEAASNDTDAAPRAETRLVVLNGAGQPGLAGETRTALETAGYTVDNIGNAAQTRRTTVQHPPELDTEAARLADDIEQVTGQRPLVRTGADGQVITLVLGTDMAA